MLLTNSLQNTQRRSALWINREVEMLGGILETSLSRENIVYKARFLRENLPYFMELMSDVLTETKFSGIWEKSGKKYLIIWLILQYQIMN